VVTQSAMAFRAILSALTVLVAKFLELSELAAGTERLDALILALAKHSGDCRLATHEQVVEDEGGRGRKGAEPGAMFLLGPCALSSRSFLTSVTCDVLSVCVGCSEVKN
jgi:hypothetical protein